MKQQQRKRCACLAALTMLTAAMSSGALQQQDAAAEAVTERSASEIRDVNADAMICSTDPAPMPIITSSEGKVTNNLSANNYTTWDTVTSSYLYETANDTLVRVESLSAEEGVLIEEFSMDYTLLNRKTVPRELPLFGGFFSGEQYHYLVFGQTNPDEDDNTEILRVVKYSKDWKRLDDCAVRGANTTIPFRSGNLRMAEANGKLYIHTSHQMYASSDGLNHQANMTYVVDTEEMTVTNAKYRVSNPGTGYASHSFTQFVQTDADYAFTLDHGDAYPRGLLLTRYRVENFSSGVQPLELYSIPGRIGNNATGVSVGGFALSDENCLIALNSVEMNEDTYSTAGKRNIYLLTVDKNLETVTEYPITDYQADSSVTVRTPQLVKLSNDAFLLMWEEYDSTTSKTKLRLMTVNGNGKPTSEVFKANIRLSDCQPILTDDGTVRWYVTDGYQTVFYTVNPYNLEQLNALRRGDVNDDLIVDAQDAQLTLRAYLNGFMGNETVLSEEERSAADVDLNGIIESVDAQYILKYYLKNTLTNTPITWDELIS